MTVIAIHQPQYLPYLGFFHKLRHCDIFVTLDHVQFQKNGLQNRNKIKNAQGWQWLTVPVIHKTGQAINEVNFHETTNWRNKHWNALTANYTRAAHFDAYAPDLKKILEKNGSNLAELDLELTGWAMSQLGIETKIVYSSRLELDGSKSDLLIKICQAVGGTHYLSGPGGRDYMDLPAFEKAGITVVWQEFVAPEYGQVFPDAGFVPNLSVVDALFCCGPETRKFLE